MSTFLGILTALVIAGVLLGALWTFLHFFDKFAAARFEARRRDEVNKINAETLERAEKARIEGYDILDAYDDSVCLRCGCVIGGFGRQRHSEWHQEIGGES